MVVVVPIVVIRLLVMEVPAWESACVGVCDRLVVGLGK